MTFIMGVSICPFVSTSRIMILNTQRRPGGRQGTLKPADTNEKQRVTSKTLIDPEASRCPLSIAWQTIAAETRYNAEELHAPLSIRVVLGTVREMPSGCSITPQLMRGYSVRCYPTCPLTCPLTAKGTAASVVCEFASKRLCSVSDSRLLLLLY